MAVEQIERDKLVVDEREAARLLSVSVACLRRWRQERRGPKFVHLGKLVRYPTSEIEALASGGFGD